MRYLLVLLLLMTPACSTTPLVSPVPTVQPEIQAVERIVREAVETPPPQCLTEPATLAPMLPGQDWRVMAAELARGLLFNGAIVSACQGWWARVEARRGE